MFTKGKQAKEIKERRGEVDENPERQWDYLARNLKKVSGISLEDDFIDMGLRGWEFVAVADGYAIFKRPLPV